MRVFDSVEQIGEAVGEELGTSDWVEIDQERVDTFADATGDHQWIHVDVERAKQGPFGGTIAHGYLTLSLIPWLGTQIFTIRTGAALNYGLNKVRFPHPVRVDDRIRMTSRVVDLADHSAGKQLVLGHVIEVDGAPKPACIAETVVVLVG